MGHSDDRNENRILNRRDCERKKPEGKFRRRERETKIELEAKVYQKPT